MRTKNPNPERCVEEVSDHDSRWPHYYQCQRKRGHGPNGEYCKEHALKFAPTFTVWLVTKGHVSVREAEAVKVSQKTIWSKGGRREARSSSWGTYFDTQDEAYTHAEKVLNARLDRLRSQIKDTEEQIARLGVVNPDNGKE